MGLFDTEMPDVRRRSMPSGVTMSAQKFGAATTAAIAERVDASILPTRLR